MVAVHVLAPPGGLARANESAGSVRGRTLGQGEEVDSRTRPIFRVVP